MNAARVCSQCHTEYSAIALSCPSCHALTHRERLEELSELLARATEANQRGRQQSKLEEMRDLLPRGSRQHSQVVEQLQRLGPSKNAARGKLAGLGALGFFVWKFKALLLFALGKGKLLLLGLTKIKTLGSMLLFLSVYWSLWGWQFALGFVLSIYVHEMGHVAALRTLGISATAPMFVPFVGAFVRLKDYPRTPREDAIVGLAGPTYGAVAALACYLIYVATGSELMGAVARTGAWLNLFNLIPVWQLDGGRGFNALARRERIAAVALVLAAFALTGEGLLLLLAAGATYRAVAGAKPQRSDRRTVLTYASLVALLSALYSIHLPSLPA